MHFSRRTDQTGAKIQFGGLKFGLTRAAYRAPGTVKRPMRRPPPKTAKMNRMRDQMFIVEGLSRAVKFLVVEIVPFALLLAAQILQYVDDSYGINARVMRYPAAAETPVSTAPHAMSTTVTISGQFFSVAKFVMS